MVARKSNRKLLFSFLGKDLSDTYRLYSVKLLCRVMLPKKDLDALCLLKILEHRGSFVMDIQNDPFQKNINNFSIFHCSINILALV